MSTVHFNIEIEKHGQAQNVSVSLQMLALNK
jgi:hypothetical protein